MGDGTEAGMFAKLKSGVARMFTGEDIFLAQFINEPNDSQILRFGTNYPGHVIPLNLADWGDEIIAMSGAYLLGSPELKLSMCFKQSLGAAFFGGESLVLQKITGPGIVILQGGGCVMKEELTPDRPKILVDTGCLVAMTTNVEYSIRMVGLKSF